MTVLLALLCVFNFALSIPMNVLDFSKLIEKIAINTKKIEKAREAWKQAKVTGINEDEAWKAYSSATDNSLSSLFTGCLVALFSVTGHLIVTIGEIVIIVAALALHVGIPLIGYSALGVFALILVYDFLIYPKIYAKEEAKAKSLDNVYIPKTGFLRKFFGWIPDIYALYVLLVIIGLLT